jgi:diguanylate cyclase (GGDEF)-like protein/PAS domain S-box-containing protein
MGRLTPLIRISVSLVFMTCTILLTADMIGLLPRGEDTLVEERIQFCERLASQAATGTSREDLAALRRVLELTALRDDDLTSAGLREPGGRLILASAEHRDQWKPENPEGSTSTHVRIPLFNAGGHWATLEARFRDTDSLGVMAALWDRPVFPILAFVSAIGSLGYFLYMRRTLRHLDPSAVVPARVQMALDVMAEGVVLIDEEEQIVLANASFVEQVGVPQTQLLGTRLHDIEWRHKNAPGIDLSLPWNAVLSESKQSTGAEMTLLRDEEERVFVVNASPILDGWDKAKGAIVTFDDITELARRTAELEHSNALLEKSQEEIQLQYQELEELSKRDPLTGVSNRRACLEVFEEKFESARGGDSLLSCVMVDVDYFKRINDDHGHGTGDEVLRQLAVYLHGEVRTTDFVCRWGGEEFILLFEEDVETTSTIATRLRKHVGSPGFTQVPVTASFGVATVAGDVANLQELIARADAALYASKEGGRNRVTRWDQMDHDESASDEAVS